MTSKTSIIVISTFAVLMSSAVTLKAQTPPAEQTAPPAAVPPVTRDVDRRDDDFDWGWIGLLGLLGLGGLAGRRRDDVVGTTRPRP
jgi:MYXO-CTERM domain-containing protein